MLIHRQINGETFAIELSEEELEMAFEEVRRKRDREDIESFIDDHSDEFDQTIDVSTLTDAQIDAIIFERDENYTRDDEYCESLFKAITAIISE